MKTALTVLFLVATISTALAEGAVPLCTNGLIDHWEDVESLSAEERLELNECLQTLSEDDLEAIGLHVLYEESSDTTSEVVYTNDLSFTTWVSLDFPSNNFGNSTLMLCSYTSSAKCLFGFPTTCPPSGSVFVGASVWAYVVTNGLGGTTTWYTAAPSSNWSETGLNWNNKPGFYSGSKEGTSKNSSDVGWTHFNASTTFQNQCEDVYNPYGFYLWHENSSFQYYDLSFYTEDQSSSMTPYLKVIYATTTTTHPSTTTTHPSTSTTQHGTTTTTTPHSTTTTTIPDSCCAPSNPCGYALDGICEFWCLPVWWEIPDCLPGTTTTVPTLTTTTTVPSDDDTTDDDSDDDSTEDDDWYPDDDSDGNDDEDDDSDDDGNDGLGDDTTDDDSENSSVGKSSSDDSNCCG